MKRMVVAAFLASSLHGAAFWATGHLTQPALPLARSRSVTLNLVSVQTIEEEAPGPAPQEVLPRPKPEPKPKTKAKQKPKRLEKPVPKPAGRILTKPHPPTPRPRPESPVDDRKPAPPEAEQAPPSGPPDRPAPEKTATNTPAAPSDAGPAAHNAHAAIRASVPLYDLNPPPVYPWVARRRNYQGTVLLDVRVTAEGLVAEVKVARSSGYPVLDRSALKSVRHWRFEPARRGSHPIETWVQVPVRFELN
jgi:protein TonB